MCGLKSGFIAVGMLAALSSTVFGQAKSAIEFYDTTGTTSLSKFGWTGDAASGNFFIRTPNDGTNGITVKQGNITANKFTGDGSGLTNLPIPSSSNLPFTATTGLTDTLGRKADTNYVKAQTAKVTAANLPGLHDSLALKAAASHQHATTDITWSSGSSGQVWKLGANGQPGWGAAISPTSLPPSGTASGDLSGTYPNPTVPGLANKANLSGAAFTGPISVSNSTLFPQIFVNGSTGVQQIAIGNSSDNPNGLLVKNDNQNLIEIFSYGTAYSSGALSLGVNRTGNCFVMSTPATAMAIGPRTNAALVLSTYNEERVRIAGDGKVGIGIKIPSEALDVAGNIKASGTITPSDERLKERIVPIGDALGKISRLRGVTYYWKTAEFPEQHFSPNEQVGVIAQEVEKVLPQVVTTDNNGFKAVDYSRLTALLIQAANEQQAHIELQNEQIAKQQEQINSQQQQIDILMRKSGIR